MAERTLIARVREDEANPGSLVVSSPVVGLVDPALRTGVFLNPYDRVLTLLVLGRRHVLRLPRDVQGWVVETHVANELTPVAFGTPLLRIDPRMEGRPGGAGTVPRGGAKSADDAAAGGAIVVKAPTEGIFYRKASPGAPSFVEVGARVGPGTVLGLVEVMKCFNQIAYGGPGLPESGEVVKILVEDATEVHFGQALFWIKAGA